MAGDAGPGAAVTSTDMASSPPLAVIAVTYSPGEHLEACLESLAQDNVRIVMVDNGSTDGSVERAQESGAAELLRSGGNIGYGAGMNLGIEHLRAAREAGEIDSEFLLITNPDVVFEPNTIAQLLEAARRHPRAGAIGPRIVEADGTFYPSARAIPTIGSGIGHALLSGVWPSNPFTRAYHDAADMTRERPAGWLSGSCLLLRWEAFLGVGGFDERYFMYMEDVDLGDRLARAGWLNIFTPHAEIRHAQGHSAKKHPEIVIRAHHESAYRFQADRHEGWRWLPLRVVLKVGLALRQRIVQIRQGR